MIDETINKSSKRVQDVLQKYAIDTKIVQFPQSTHTAQEAADAIGCTVGQIVKSLVFCIKETQQPILVLVSGSNRVDEKLLESVVGEKIKKANADFTKNVTGFAIGGIPPVGHVQKLKTFIDEDLLLHKEIWAAAGTSHTVFSLTFSDLKRITNGVIIRMAL